MKGFCQGFIVLCLFLFPSCKKGDSAPAVSLPEKTETGKNTLGFLLNSSVWRNSGQVCFAFGSGCRENLSGQYYNSDGSILILSDQVTKDGGKIAAVGSLSIRMKTGSGAVGTHRLLGNDSNYCVYKSTEGGVDATYIIPSSDPNFSVVITKFDTVQHILSGAFSGNLFRRSDSTNLATSLTDSIKVEDGRFDIRLR